MARTPPREQPAKEAMLPVSPMSITVEPLAPTAAMVAEGLAATDRLSTVTDTEPATDTEAATDTEPSKPFDGEPLKYVQVDGPYWLRNDGVVVKRHMRGGSTVAGPKAGTLSYRHVSDSPWVMLSAGAVGHEGLGSVEVAWLRADGAIDLAIDTRSSPYAGHAAALLHDADVYAGRAHRVNPPDGCRYTAAAAGVRHVCGAGISATYCLRSDGQIDRITTAGGGTEGEMLALKRRAPQRAALSTPDGATYSSIAPGYYFTHLVRADGSAIDVLGETAPKGVGPMNEEVPLDGRFECTIAAPSGTTYVGVVHQAIPAKSPREVGSHMQSDCWFLPSPAPVYLVRADGKIDVAADGKAVAATVEPPAGVAYVGGCTAATAATGPMSGEPLLALLRSDGRVDLLSNTMGRTTIAPPADGEAYVACTSAVGPDGIVGGVLTLVRGGGVVDEWQARVKPNVSPKTLESSVVRSTTPDDGEVPAPWPTAMASCCAVL